MNLQYAFKNHIQLLFEAIDDIRKIKQRLAEYDRIMDRAKSMYNYENDGPNYMVITHTTRED